MAKTVIVNVNAAMETRSNKYTMYRDMSGSLRNRTYNPFTHKQKYIYTRTHIIHSLIRAHVYVHTNKYIYAHTHAHTHRDTHTVTQ